MQTTNWIQKNSITQKNERKTKNNNNDKKNKMSKNRIFLAECWVEWSDKGTFNNPVKHVGWSFFCENNQWDIGM